MNRNRDDWMRELLMDSWVAREYPEGSVAGVILDAWLRKIGRPAAADRLAADGIGMPQLDEMWQAAEEAGVLEWDAIEDLDDAIVGHTFGKGGE